MRLVAGAGTHRRRFGWLCVWSRDPFRREDDPRFRYRKPSRHHHPLPFDDLSSPVTSLVARQTSVRSSDALVGSKTPRHHVSRGEKDWLTAQYLVNKLSTSAAPRVLLLGLFARFDSKIPLSRICRGRRTGRRPLSLKRRPHLSETWRRIQYVARVVRVLPTQSN